MADYVLRRLCVECSVRRGVAEEIAAKTGISAGHISRVRAGKKNIGLDLIVGMAHYWGLTYPELEALALRVGAACATSHPDTRRRTKAEGLCSAARTDGSAEASPSPGLPWATRLELEAGRAPQRLGRPGVALDRRATGPCHAAPAQAAPSSSGHPSNNADFPHLRDTVAWCRSQCWPDEFVDAFLARSLQTGRDRPWQEWLTDAQSTYLAWLFSTPKSKETLAPSLVPARAAPRKRRGKALASHTEARGRTSGDRLRLR